MFEDYTFSKTWELTVLPQLSPNDPACVETIAPATPSVTPSSCDAPGGLIVPPSTESITYSVEPAYTSGATGTFTVTATAADGYVFAGGQTTKVFEPLKVDQKQDCTTPPPAAVPVPVTAPVFISASCEAPNATSMTVPASNSQVAYTTTGPAVPGTTVTVTAAPIGNVVLTGYPTGGWSWSFPTVAQPQLRRCG